MDGTYVSMDTNMCLICAGQTENDALQQFLAARNPKNDHTLTLEALLIKPIQVN